MIIGDLFNWFHEDEQSFNFTNQRLSKDLLEAEHAQAKTINRILLSEVRLAKFNGLEVRDAQNQLEKHIEFIDYLDFCGKQFLEDPESSLFLVTLKYMLANTQKGLVHLNVKLNDLFTALLKEDRGSALSFYHENESLFQNHPEIQIRVKLEVCEQSRDEAVRRVEKHLAHLSKQLSNQQNPLGIIALCREWLSDTEQIAALILWLLQRQVSTKQILQTYLLHDFLKYHLFTLHSEDSEVFHLYALLNRFPEAKELIEAAQQTGSDERGFQHYALNGFLSENELDSVPAKRCPLEFSLTTANFLALHELFGLPFLSSAVITSVEHKNLTWIETLKHTLNQPEIVTQEIPALINTIAHISSPQILESLAALIDEATAQQLLSKNEGAVFYLLPYKPKLSEYINEKNITGFIHQITEKYTSESEILFQLMALFSILPKKNNPLAQLVFQAIIDNLVHHPLLLEDDRLVRHLRKFPACKRMLFEQSEKIKKQVHECIIEQAYKTPFNSHNYHIIEDLWVDATRKLAVLDLISPQEKFNLNHKYALQARIAEMNLSYCGENFDLDAFIESLSFPPVVTEHGVSEYERFLIELLAVIDNDPIRKQIIRKLENYPVLRLNWAEKEYEGKTLFLKAAKHGNLGLLDFLNDQVAPETVVEAMSKAAEYNQWKFVDRIICQTKVQLSEVDIEALILKATEHGQVNIIKSLSDTYGYEPTTGEVVKILKQAIKNNKLNVVEYFYNFSGKIPSQSVINKLFDSAVKLEFWDIALFLADSENHSPSRVTIEKAFSRAAETMQVVATKRFCTLSTHIPVSSAFHRAFVKACKSGHLPMVECLHDAAEQLPRPIIEKAVVQAISNGHQEIISYLYSSIYPPDQSLVNQGFMTAVKTGQLTLVEFFSAIANKNTPSQHVIRQAMYLTAKNGQVELFNTLCRFEQNPPAKSVIKQAYLLSVKSGKLGIVDYLCINKMHVFNQRDIEQGLILAVKFKKPLIAQYLCGLPANGHHKKILRIAYNKAVSTGQNELADFLREQLHCKKRQQKTSNSEIANRSARKNELEVEDKSNPGSEPMPTKQPANVGISLTSQGFFKAKLQRNSPTSENLVGSMLVDYKTRDF
ncbi:hypothetical protein [Legionella jordanis]|uniref:Ankyrin repeats (3 copies) n=1 Tax=Legionella jordanis TaxID=456 RepID=A0A0W0V8B4_9GAMM|nr:hypothetical protein [Legionella jordanis]KTD16379.1 Ankyrin repeats (3 copies) [Legionella jordanis]RMX04413.1 ankyrin repeat domain-containing protein [Legionella jordanis]VEH12161.1 Ankyrin repeats (3 copies) [Legionella jordanis]